MKPESNCRPTGDPSKLEVRPSDLESLVSPIVHISMDAAAVLDQYDVRSGALKLDETCLNKNVSDSLCSSTVDDDPSHCMLLSSRL
jgi:hypothetical protein